MRDRVMVDVAVFGRKAGLIHVHPSRSDPATRGFRCSSTFSSPATWHGRIDDTWYVILNSYDAAARA